MCLENMSTDIWHKGYYKSNSISDTHLQLYSCKSIVNFIPKKHTATQISLQRKVQLKRNIGTYCVTRVKSNNDLLAPITEQYILHILYQISRKFL